MEFLHGVVFLANLRLNVLDAVAECAKGDLREAVIVVEEAGPGIGAQLDLQERDVGDDRGRDVGDDEQNGGGEEEEGADVVDEACPSHGDGLSTVKRRCVGECVYMFRLFYSLVIQRRLGEHTAGRL